MEIINNSPITKARKNPINPKAGNPNSVGPPFTVMTMDEPTIRAAAIIAIVSLLVLWSS